LIFNYEEENEHSVSSDKTIEIIGEFVPVDVNVRDVGMEPAYDYAQRVGIWRVLNILKKHRAKATFLLPPSSGRQQICSKKNRRLWS
jgi:peptidoglycan/xylan/chitin deacetylase (PgdA/CDA1 family)